MRKKLVKLCLPFSYVAQNSLHFDEFFGVKKIPTAKRRRSIYEFRNQGKAESRRHCQGWECKAERDAQVKSGLIFSSAENSLGVKLTVLRLVEKKKKTSSPRPNSFISSRLFLFSVLSALLLSRFCWGSSVASNHHRGQTRVLKIHVNRFFGKKLIWKIWRNFPSKWREICCTLLES